jgi:hypothetical protein
MLNEPGCVNPVQLEHTTVIDTAASVTLLTKKTPAASTTQPNIQISVVQPGGDCITTTHAIDLLLSNLPPEACLAHRLPGLVINLFTIAILCDTSCKVFFHKTGCKVTLDGKTILQGWSDPKKCLWCVMIFNDGWMTKLTVRDVTRPIIPLSTTPTGHLASSMPIMPSKSNMTLANSLYKCYNTGQLKNYHFACLNYPVKSTLTKAIDRGYLKVWQRLTSQRTRRHILVSTKSEMGHMDQQCQGVQSTQSTPTTVPIQSPHIFDDPIEDVPQDPTMPALTLSSWPSTKNNGNLFTNQTDRFPITSKCGDAYVVVFHIFDANTNQSILIKNQSKDLCAYCKIYKCCAVSNLSYTNFTTKHPRVPKRLPPRSKLASSTLSRTFIAQTQPNVPLPG